MNNESNEALGRRQIPRSYHNPSVIMQMGIHRDFMEQAGGSSQVQH